MKYTIGNEKINSKYMNFILAQCMNFHTLLSEPLETRRKIKLNVCE